MTKEYIIYVACGSAAASASLARRRLVDQLEIKKVPADCEIYRVSELTAAVKSKKPDAIVVTAGQAPKDLPEDIVVVKGIPLMTGFGIEKLVDDLLADLEKAGQG